MGLLNPGGAGSEELGGWVCLGWCRGCGKRVIGVGGGVRILCSGARLVCGDMGEFGAGGRRIA